MNDMRPASIKYRGQTEINHLGYTSVPVLCCEHDVLGLHITMDHTHTVTIHGRQQRMSYDLGDEMFRQHFVGLFAQHLAIPATQAFQDEHEAFRLAVVAVFVQAYHVAMIQPLQGLDLQQTSRYLGRLQFFGLHRLAHPHFLGSLVSYLHDVTKRPTTKLLQHIIRKLPIFLMPLWSRSKQSAFGQPVCGDPLDLGGDSAPVQERRRRQPPRSGRHNICGWHGNHTNLNT
mmetsp:Transcript_42697/g.96194  ORF Transcript_42697/g.96194 Transcript_42697/m.96194 type:complete len:230 (-) Transcript_42697:9-698(-)